MKQEKNFERDIHEIGAGEEFHLDKSEDFSEWFNRILLHAGVLDPRYNVKGMDIFLPYGLNIYERILDELEKLFYEIGHQKVRFPTLISKRDLEQEEEHIKGFKSEVFLVTKSGEKELSRPLALRPTSEVPIYRMFRKWIVSDQDLPLKIFQTVSMFRCEGKGTRPLIRVQDVFWNEGHSAHKTREKAEKHLEKIWEADKKLVNDYLALDGLVLKRPEWDKFPGAKHTSIMDVIMPDGKLLQIVGNHLLGQKFPKAFDITFEDSKGEHKTPYTTSYGVSTRLLAAVIGVHGDNTGLVLPPRIAPVQVVIVPIPSDEDRILEVSRTLKEKLVSEGIRTTIDDTDKSIGEKFYYWERKGTPLRIEIGSEEIKKEKTKIVRRDINESFTIAFDNILEVKKIEEKIQENLLKQSKKKLRDRIRCVETIEELKQACIQEGGIALAPFCSRDEEGEECAEMLPKGLHVRGTKYPEPEAPTTGQDCIICGKKATVLVYIGREH